MGLLNGSFDDDDTIPTGDNPNGDYDPGNAYATPGGPGTYGDNPQKDIENDILKNGVPPGGPGSAFPNGLTPQQAAALYAQGGGKFPSSLTDAASRSLTNPNGGNTVNNNTTNPGTSPSMFAGLAPSLITLISNIASKNQYGDIADKAASMTDPFGPQRAQYQKQLSDLYADPSKVTNTPGYKFALSHGLGAVANRDNQHTGVGSGTGTKDQMDYASGLASQTYNTEANRLMQLAGGNFSPGNVGGIYSNEMNASALQNSAIANSLGNIAGQMVQPTTNSSNVPNIPNLNPVTTTPNLNTLNDVNNHITGGDPTIPAGNSGANSPFTPGSGGGLTPDGQPYVPPGGA